MKPCAYVYIDGFNLYNGLKRRARNKRVPVTEYRWLDLVALSDYLLPNHDVQLVKYFTSVVMRRAGEEQAGQRQDIFLSALRTLDRIEIIRGKFQRNEVLRELVKKPGKLVPVIDYKEKRSDVNLASQLLKDAYEGSCMVAAIISADSDLKMPIEIAVGVLPLGVKVLNPNLPKTCRQLEVVATEYEWIPEAAFRLCQLPQRLRGKKGRLLERPKEW